MDLDVKRYANCISIVAFGLLSACASTQSTSNSASETSLEETLDKVTAISSRSDRADLSAMIPQCVNVMANRPVNAAALASRKIVPAKLLLGQQIYERYISGPGIGKYAQFVRLYPNAGRNCALEITMSLRGRLEKFRSNSGEVLQANGFRRSERTGFVGQSIVEYISSDGTIKVTSSYNSTSRAGRLDFSKI